MGRTGYTYRQNFLKEKRPDNVKTDGTISKAKKKGKEN